MAKRRTIPEQLRQAIQDDGRGLPCLARDSGVNYGVLYRFTHGQRDITLGTADRICKVLGLELRKE
jgi:DNA-binding phage protein